MEPVDLQSLWICGALWIHGAQAPWSPGSAEPRIHGAQGSAEPRICGARAILAPTGMAAYHINGNTIHSGLHININKKELAPLNNSELNMLRSKYVYRFSNIILANEHRSLGPIFVFY